MGFPTSTSHIQPPYASYIPSNSYFPSDTYIPYQPTHIPTSTDRTHAYDRIPRSEYDTTGTGGKGTGEWPAYLPVLPIPPTIPPPTQPQLHATQPPGFVSYIPDSRRKNEVHIPGLEDAMNRIHISQARNRHYSSSAGSSPYRYDQQVVRDKPLPPVPPPVMAPRPYTTTHPTSYVQRPSPLNPPFSSPNSQHHRGILSNPTGTSTSHLGDFSTAQVYDDRTNTTYNIHVHLPSPPPSSRPDPTQPTIENGRIIFEPDSRTMYKVNKNKVGSSNGGKSQSTSQINTISTPKSQPHLPGSFPSTILNPSTPIRPNQRKHASSLPPFLSPSITTSPSPFPSSPSPTSTSIRCSGFTQKGEPCKRLVRATSPYALLELKSESSSIQREQRRIEEDGNGKDIRRYCRDHALQICGAEGFYWKGDKSDGGKWVVFDHWVPDDLDDQTKVLLRLTMESHLTPKESTGFIYAYELRDLQTTDLAYFKVGRTDNVPRRMDEWRKQCTTHSPTLREIFPPHCRDSSRQEHVNNSSMIPGAMKKGEDGLWGIKRLERLIHIELAARSSLATVTDRTPCRDCSTIHREIFPIARQGGNKMSKQKGGEYEMVIRPVVERWVRFVASIIANG